MTSQTYIAKDRLLQGERFDFLITDETARLWYDGSFDQALLERDWCKRHIKRGDTVVDCGAHHGMMSILFSRWVGPEGRVIAYEPLLGNAKVALENADLNRLSNITVRSVGVGDRAGHVAMHLNKGNVAACETGGDGQIEVVRLDDDLPAGTIVNFLKIDVEGSELRAIEGAKRILRHRPTIDLELHNFLFANRRKTLGAITKYISPAQWTYDVLGENRWSETKHFDGPIDIDWLASFENPHVFCTPRKRIKLRYWVGDLLPHWTRPVRRKIMDVLACRLIRFELRSLFIDPLGSQWEVKEGNWLGIWIRRSGTNVFDAVWTKNDREVRAVITVQRHRDQLTITRSRSTDGNDLVYLGTITRSEISGTYPGGPWSAHIRY